MKRGLYYHSTSRYPHCPKGIPGVVYGTRCVGHNNLTYQHYNYVLAGGETEVKSTAELVTELRQPDP